MLEGNRTPRLSQLLLAMAICAFQSAASAQSLTADFKSFYSRQYEYFRELPEPLLPIFVPAGEKVGDVYRDKFGRFYSRQNECFPGLKVEVASSVLPGGVETSNAQLGGELRADAQHVARAAAEAGLHVDERVRIQFDAVQVYTASDVQLKRVLKQSKDCAPVAAVASGQTGETGVLVLGQVFVGTRVIVASAAKGASAGASAKVEPGAIAKLSKALKALSPHANISVKAGGESNVAIQASTDKKVPFGFRPAFISQSHLRLILEQSRQVAYLEKAVRSGHNALAVARANKELVPLPDQLIRDMTTGPIWVRFSVQNPEHQRYLRNVNLLLALGTELLLVK